MAIEFFNFGVNAASEAASKLQKIANNEVQKETDEMFGRLHEDYIKEQEREDAAKKKADYNPYEDEERQQEQKQRGGYNPDDYERVAFSGAVGAKNQALYFAQYMKDQGVNDVVVSPVKINGEYMVEIPKTAMIREKVEPEQEQPTVTKLNHDEQDFLRRQLENVAAQEEAKKPKPAEPEMTEAVTDVTTEPQQAAAQPVPDAEPAYSEPNTYESSYTEHTDTAEPVYDRQQTRCRQKLQKMLRLRQNPLHLLRKTAITAHLAWKVCLLQNLFLHMEMFNQMKLLIMVRHSTMITQGTFPKV